MLLFLAAHYLVDYTAVKYRAFEWIYTTHLDALYYFEKYLHRYSSIYRDENLCAHSLATTVQQDGWAHPVTLMVKGYTHYPRRPSEFSFNQNIWHKINICTVPLWDAFRIHIISYTTRIRKINNGPDSNWELIQNKVHILVQNLVDSITHSSFLVLFSGLFVWKRKALNSLNCSSIFPLIMCLAFISILVRTCLCQNLYFTNWCGLHSVVFGICWIKYCESSHLILIGNFKISVTFGWLKSRRDNVLHA